MFAGPVGRGLHVVVRHPDGIRTSYSFLATVVVRRGDRVRGGQAVGSAGPTLHWGARAGDAYVDPLLLLRRRPAAAHLVPDDERARESEAAERAALARALRRRRPPPVAVRPPRAASQAGTAGSR